MTHLRIPTLLLALVVSTGAFGQPEPPLRGSVILLVGDGLGAAQLALGLHYARFAGRNLHLHLQHLMSDGNTGYALALPHESTVIDSAAAATHFATGRTARNESLSLDVDGYPVETILEWAEKEGVATGLVTNMRLTHATPAAFAAHRVSRYDPEGAIAEEILEHDIEVLLGGGGRALVPAGRRVSEVLPGIAPELDGVSRRSDDRNLVDEARARGYRVSSRETLAKDAADAKKLLGVFASEHLPYVLDREHLGIAEAPTLREMIGAALLVLERSPSFFLMVEGGRIDYAGHDNDAGAMLHEILDFDEAVGAALAFQEQRPDTLVIVTADHGTGGFSFTYGDGTEPESFDLASGFRYHTDHRYPGREELEMLYRQKASYKHVVESAGTSPERLVAAVRELLGLELTREEAAEALRRDADGNAWTVDFRPFYGDTESNPACLLARALARHTHVVWSTGGHTMEPVLTFGRGPGAEALRGFYPSTDIHGVMKAALGPRPR
jgi:alkaline phosphatase